MRVLIVAVLPALLCLGCTRTVGVGGQGSAGGVYSQSSEQVAPLGIPMGHLPPPGECRIWFPGVPAGQQPPPGNCAALEHEVPAGAWLLYRPKEEHVRVSVCDESRANVFVSVRLYEAETGVFIRYEQR